MITRFIQYLLEDEHAWDDYVDVLAGLPDNY